MYADTDLIDIDGIGVMVEGLSLGQLRKLMKFYQHRTHDMDFVQLDLFTKGL